MGLTNSQYNTIMREYSRRQLEESRALADRREQAYRLCPQLQELDASAASSAVSAVRARLSGQKAVTPDFSEIAARRAALLSEAGLPADHLQPHPVCPDCGDTGYIGTEKCHCFRQLALDLFYAQTDLADDSIGFDQFDLNYYPDVPLSEGHPKTIRAIMADVLSTCRRFVDEFDRSGRNLLFYGKTGLGKTFLSQCIAKELTRSLHSVVYCSASSIFDRLAEYTFSKEPQDTSFVTECDLLIIDDLGTELNNSFVISSLFSILTARAQAGKSTIISTNLALADLAPVYSDRIASRITSEFTLLGFYGRDIRIAKKLRRVSG